MQVTVANRLTAEVKALNAEIDNLRAEVAKRTARLATLGSGHHKFEAGTVKVSENNTYDADAIEAALRPGQVKRCSVLKLDKPTVKRLYPEVYESAKRTNGHKVSVS